MLNTHSRHQCITYFRTEVKYDIINNNLIEAFNGKIIKARTKNIYSILKDIRKLVFKRLVNNRKRPPNGQETLELELGENYMRILKKVVIVR